MPVGIPKVTPAEFPILVATGVGDADLDCALLAFPFPLPVAGGAEGTAVVDVAEAAVDAVGVVGVDIFEMISAEEERQRQAL